MLRAPNGDFCEIGRRLRESVFWRTGLGPQVFQDAFVRIGKPRQEFGSQRWLDVGSVRTILILRRERGVRVMVVDVVDSCRLSVFASENGSSGTFRDVDDDPLIRISHAHGLQQQKALAAHSVATDDLSQHRFASFWF